MSFLQFTQPVQTKLWQYTHAFAAEFTKPVHKFIRQMLFGILKSGSVQLNDIGRALQEKLALKKVTKRLSAHLDKADLWEKVSKATLRSQSTRLKKCRFAIFDLSDIRKDYAEKMEGLAKVYDGSKDEIVNGYWLCNISAVNDTASAIVPAYSELFSHEAEVTSENKKILQAADQVLPFCAPDTVSVFDRGGDRKTLISAFLEHNRPFIIRQKGERDLVYKGHKMPLKAIAKKTKLRWTFKTARIHKNRIKRRMYTCGAVPIEMPGDRKHQRLWLVVMKRHGGGYCWLLAYLPACTKAKQVVTFAIKGYGLRWKIEEVHRQIKADYQLEAICLQRYQALKTMNALLWMAVSFLYTRLESLAIAIIAQPELGLLNRRKLKDLLRFVYYKLAYAFKKIMAVARFYDPTKATKKNRQLALQLSV